MKTLSPAQILPHEQLPHNGMSNSLEEEGATGILTLFKSTDYISVLVHLHVFKEKGRPLTAPETNLALCRHHSCGVATAATHGSV